MAAAGSLGARRCRRLRILLAVAVAGGLWRLGRLRLGRVLGISRRERVVVLGRRIVLPFHGVASGPLRGGEVGVRGAIMGGLRVGHIAGRGQNVGDVTLGGADSRAVVAKLHGNGRWGIARRALRIVRDVGAVDILLRRGRLRRRLRLRLLRQAKVLLTLVVLRGKISCLVRDGGLAVRRLRDVVPQG